MIYKIKPVSKPRMTQRDRWAKRECVQRYWKFKDQVREAGLAITESCAHVIFVLPMPKSWSKKKKHEMWNKPHQQKPDVDNLMKALLDAIFDDDAHIWDARVTKVWGHQGVIIINQIEEPSICLS